jgi:hypothetical protein
MDGRGLMDAPALSSTRIMHVKQDACRSSTIMLQLHGAVWFHCSRSLRDGI